VASADPAWLDEQYDARAASPDHPAIFARWAQASAAARAGARVEGASHVALDLRYGPGSLQTADWFAAADPRAPMLVFVHGGYWRGSDKSLYSFIASPFVRAGASVVLLNYDLCPDVTIETIVREIDDAIDWIAGRAPSASRIMVSGHSAGGHLAAWMLACRNGRSEKALDTARVESGLGISGLYDLEPIRRVPSLAPDLRLDHAAARRLSPVNYPAPADAVFHAFVGGDESDEFHRQSALLAQRWGPQAVPVCEMIAGRRHFDVLEELADPGGRLFASAKELLFSDRE